MKHLRLTLLLFITSCTYFSTPQQKAEQLAKAYLDTAVANFNTYRLVASMPIDTLREGPDSDPAYQLLTAKIDSTRHVADALSKAYIVTQNANDRAALEKRISRNSDVTNTLLQQSLQYMLNYHGKPNGWILEQTYRSTDSTLYIHIFKMDEKFNSVVAHQSLKKE
ncbi:hypothetical protein [Mucilaginibacter auburnensis]|uniref:Uncharacterized protein n=1 Tax=Mucilaginibacter auburnensis TaxID=1457233 RepID=A0A2H9VR01_9SPHI|nr:hypothetical protein [Mucilaginibacter auburnensis]PJJ83223.1 hypothetical protein CLV57_0201 [Mucilaginibacter auburnensis]